MPVRILIATLLLCLAPLPVTANATEIIHGLIASNGMTLDAAVRQVKQQTGGRILSAETITRNGKKMHRIKVLLPDGTVRVMMINAS
ncbi:MAG: hypothetical protein PVF21_03225 [Thiohalophilus sp.]|jgi:hypothetical protein